MIVVNLGYDLILGKYWLQRHRILVDVANRRLIFPQTKEEEQREEQEDRAALAK
ncbi:hypothetical protein QBC45DRAFT_327525 [Copromyces sp. CBS 386.78]|nr:hypothetical protein QBC45DRAFT_327525 [Copromyces sp. CBS 386.78]